MDFGQRVRLLRRQAGLSQSQLGRLCGFKGRCAWSTVQHWEHGRREPQLKTLRSLANALGVTIDQLIP